MQSTNLKTVLNALHRIAPLRYAEAWDNVGLLLEPPMLDGRLTPLDPPDAPPSDLWHSQIVNHLFLTIDLTEPVLTEAVAQSADMIVAYHPPIFHPLKRLTHDDPAQRVILAAASEGMAIYSPHTALDAAPGGVTDWLADGLGPGTREPIQPASQHAKMLKLVIYVPEEDIEQLRQCLSTDAGCGWIGQYSQCSFNLPGTGTFFGHEYANPTVGKKNRLETVQEIRMEMSCPTDRLADAAAVIQRVHSYEEPAWDAYPLAPQPCPGTGAGRIAYLDQAATLNQLTNRIKQYLNLEHVRVAAARRHLEGETIDYVALCPGAGGSIFQGLDGPQLYITGEMRHHDVLQRVSEGASVILTDHTHTERGYLSHMKTRLNELLGTQVNISISQVDADPLVIR